MKTAANVTAGGQLGLLNVSIEKGDVKSVTRLLYDPARENGKYFKKRILFLWGHRL